MTDKDSDAARDGEPGKDTDNGSAANGSAPAEQGQTSPLPEGSAMSVGLEDRADQDSDAVIPSRDMPFLDHLEELRWRILKSIGVVLLGAIVCFIFSDPLMKVLTYPYQEAVLSLENQRAAGPVEAVKQLLAEWLGNAPDAGEPVVTRVEELPMGRRLQSLKPMTYFFVSLQIALLGGIVLALPVVFYQAWQFVAPGLLRRERRLLVPIVLLSVLCFAVGALVAYWIVLPVGLRFFLALEPPDMTSQWAVDEYISFVLRLLLGFGLVFEMPVVSFFLARVGLITAAYLRRIRRYAVIGIFVVGAIFTPPDPLSQMFMVVPLLGLYEISVWVAKISERRGTG